MFAPRSPYALTALIVALLAAPVALAGPAQASTVWDRVAACEATGNWSISTGNGYFGGLQFSHSTWIAYGGGAYAANASGASKSAQIAVAQRVLAGQGPGAWPVCSLKAGLTRANGASAVSRTLVKPRVALGKLVVDGRMGPLTQGSMNRHNVRLTTVTLVRAWQARLHVKVDGIAGPQTISALQRWLNAR